MPSATDFLDAPDATAAPSAADFLDAPTAPPADPHNPQLKAWTPTLGERFGNLLHEVRASGPVEKIMGRTPEEIAATPAAESAPTTHDEGAMGLFSNTKPMEPLYDQPKTALEGLHNWAAGVVNSVASPGGLATAPLTGPAKIMGPVVQKALLLTFGAQGAKMTYEGAKDLVEKQWSKPSAADFLDDQPAASSAQTVMDVGNMLAGGLMMAGGKSALARERPSVQTPARPTPAEDWLPSPAAAPMPSAAEFLDSASPSPALTPEIPTATAPLAEPATPIAPAPAEAPQVSPIAAKALADLSSARQPIPATLLPQAGVAPEALADGYALNADGTHYEFTEPAKKLTAEQEMARANVQAMAELRAQKAAAPAPAPEELRNPDTGETPGEYAARLNDKSTQSGFEPDRIERGWYNQIHAALDSFKAGRIDQNQLQFYREAFKKGTGQDSTPIDEELNKPSSAPMPVDVSLAEVKAAATGARAEAAPDILDVVGDHYPNGVRFDPEDHGDIVKESRGAAAEQMFTTKGEPADQVLKGLHEAGMFQRLQTADDLANAMKAAGDARIGQRNGGADALELARQQKRTELFEQNALQPRAGETEPTPAGQLFVGDRFTVNDQPVRVVNQVVDAETGQPSHLEVDGAYGKQTIPADATVHMDKGSLQSDIKPSAPLPPETPFNRVRVKASKGAAPKRGLNAKWVEANLGDLRAELPGAPELHIVQSVTDLPEPHRSGALRDLRQGYLTKGIFADGKAWLIADHLTDLKEAKETYLEETLGHGGMEPLVKPGEIDRLYDLIRRGAPEKAAEIMRNYGHDVNTVSGRAAFVGEFVAKASEWHLAAPRLFQRIADVMRRLAYRVGWLRNIAPSQVLAAQMRGLARQAAGRLRASKMASLDPNRLSPSEPQGEDSTGPKFSRVKMEADDSNPERQFHQQLQGSTDISDALKGDVTNSTYTRRPQEDDQAFAQRIVQTTGGPDQARAVFNDATNGLPEPVRMAVGMQILKGLDAAGRHVDAANFFDLDMAPHTTDVAQGLAMLNSWSAMSKEGMLEWGRQKMFKAEKDATDPVRRDVEAAKTELQKQNAAGIERTTADPAVQAGAKEAIVNSVADSMETHAGVVMELTGPWAASKYILDTARQIVGAKANDLLTKQPRPIGFTAAQHLRAIMDDLAKRAADIAAGHYQGAEPGVVLKDKLVQRLGISPDAAGRLANALDKEFARQVAAAKDALPKRIARQIERAKQGLPADATETAVDRSIRRQLATAKTSLGQVVREHWTKVDATGAELKDKLVKQAGLPEDAARKLADTIQRRFEALTAQAKANALKQLLKPVQRLGLAKPQMVEKLIKLSNVGAFDDAKYWNAIKERMDLPTWTANLRAELAGLADKIARIPPDRIEDIQRAQTDFLNAVERAKGVSNLELGLAFYMQNILSGLTTHVRVAIHTSAQMMAATAAETGQAILGGRVQDIPLIYEALARGAGKALHQQKDIMRSGLVVGSKLHKVVPLSVLEQIHFGQKGGTTVKQGPIARALLENKAATLLNLWKYNARLITAQHMIYFKPTEEMKLALLASRQARTEGLTGRAAVDRARQMLGYGAAQVRAAEAQAMREGLAGTRAKMRVAEILQSNLPSAMKENAKDYALRQTFLQDPYGFAGTIANIVASAKQSPNAIVATGARVIVPFTRTAANLFNEGLNYSPIGAARAKFARTELVGQKFADITPEVRGDLQRELYAKAALGTMLLTGIAFKAAQGLNQPNPGFTVYGAGPTNPQDKAAWRAAGGIPYSAKIGGRYVSYANTPGNVMLATLGNYLDGVRDAALYQRPGAKRLAEDLPMRTAAATIGASKVILEQPFLQSLIDIAQISGENNPEVAARGGMKTLARTASSFVVPNLLRQADRFYDPTQYDQRQLSGILTSQVPFVRQQGRPMLNALGQPIQSPVFGMFTSPRTSDSVVQTLVDHNAWPTIPDRNRTAVNGVPLSDDEFYLYTKTRGEALAKMLNTPAAKNQLARLDEVRERFTALANAASSPPTKAAYTAEASRLVSDYLAQFTGGPDGADEQAADAVIRQRGY